MVQFSTHVPDGLSIADIQRAVPLVRLFVAAIITGLFA